MSTFPRGDLSRSPIPRGDSSRSPVRRDDFTRLFNPRAVAVIGASPDTARIGGQPIPILLESGYQGRIYPVNPKYQTLGELACYPDVAAVPKPCDLALVAVAAHLVPGVITQCGAAGIPFATVFSAVSAKSAPRAPSSKPS